MNHRLMKLTLSMLMLSPLTMHVSVSADNADSKPQATISTFAQAREHFFSFYPPAGRAVLENPSGISNQVPKNLCDAVNDPGKLLAAVCLSLGSTDPRNA